jgi:hypothetical protein
LSHSAVDFEKIRRGAIKISKRTRDALAKIKTGVNDAWAAVRLGSDGKLKEHVAMNPYTKNPAPETQAALLQTGVHRPLHPLVPPTKR